MEQEGCKFVVVAGCRRVGWEGCRRAVRAGCKRAGRAGRMVGLVGCRLVEAEDRS